MIHGGPGHSMHNKGIARLIPKSVERLTGWKKKKPQLKPLRMSMISSFNSNFGLQDFAGLGGGFTICHSLALLPTCGLFLFHPSCPRTPIYCPIVILSQRTQRIWGRLEGHVCLYKRAQFSCFYDQESSLQPFPFLSTGISKKIQHSFKHHLSIQLLNLLCNFPPVTSEITLLFYVEAWGKSTT